MKKEYCAPSVEVEIFELSMAVAGCALVVSSGPEVGSHKGCEDYEELFKPSNSMAMFSAPPQNIDFYEDSNCDCYTSGGQTGFWQS